jgi:hypothetical protein
VTRQGDGDDNDGDGGDAHDMGPAAGAGATAPLAGLLAWQRVAPFFHRSNDRRLPRGFLGDVFIWDIDKTYLDTRFSSLRGLLAIPFELAVDKRNIAGAAPLLRAIRTGPDPRAPALSPLYFVSGSPPNLRGIVERKMTLDGVQFDGITFKDQWALVKAGRPAAIKEQVGYKMCALLLLRRELPATPLRFYFFGDDVEKDMQVFLLFGAVCAGLRGGPLRERLRKEGAFVLETEAAVELAATLPVEEADPVARVFIHSDKGRYLVSADLDPRVVVTRSFLQTAHVLAALGKLPGDAVDRVRDELIRRRVDKDTIASLERDARERLLPHAP